ncbi:SEL1-like repeat protein [Francisella sp. LA112445]|uniref:tetratricopeptide repeat protein n=1 Tax=Francisella sp. LA112445 TaxID=1395624 RepID=UPI001788D2EB|nr:SEL1-like repeat protein [Francisella sp. LA112445]QIW10042.1 sel1 repeat family protein [Francisella sp. LA112445]
MSEKDNPLETTKARSKLLASQKKDNNKTSSKKDKLLIPENKSSEKVSSKKKRLLISEEESDNKISNQNDKHLVFDEQDDDKTFNKDSESLVSEKLNSVEASNENNEPLATTEDKNNNETLNENEESIAPKNEGDKQIPSEVNKSLAFKDQNENETSNDDNEHLITENINVNQSTSEDNQPLVSEEHNNSEPLVYLEEDRVEPTKPTTSKKKKIIRVLIGVAIVGVCAVGVNKYIDYRHEVFLQEYNKAIADINSKNVKGYEAAFEILQDLADDDEATPSDYYYLGYLYQYGFGTQKNYSNAYKYYKKANNAQAFYQIAILYKFGQGVNKDNDKALEYFKKSYKAGNKNAIIGLAKLLESNPRLISAADPELLYQIYLAYQSNKIKEIKPNEKDKYLSIAVSKGYDPATIKQAQIFAQDKDYHRASILWQTLLYSSNPKTADLAEKEMTKIETLIKEQREKELEEKTTKKEIIEKKSEPKSEEAKQKLIENNRKIGLSIPKKELESLNGLVYINLFNTDKEKLQNFYKSLSGIEIENGWIINSKDNNPSYINNLIDLAQFKHNKSSLRFDFGDKDNTNKYEGLVYYFYNNKNELIQNTINNIIQNKPKQSSLTPRLNSNNLLSKNIDNKSSTQQGQKNILDQLQERKTVNSQKQNQEHQNQNKQENNQIQLTYKEKVQRMQVFAQKGDYKELYKLEHAASDGDVYAIYYTGIYYYNLKDYKKAMEYFEEASSKNYGPADYMLGNMYYDEQENGIPYNKEKAKMYYKKAANLGVKNAEHLLMLMD